MANDIIRPVELPPRANPVASEIVPSDNGSVVGGVTWADGVNAGRPLANQVEAEAGVNSTKAMTPLTTKQAIDAQVGGLIDQAIDDLNLGTAAQKNADEFATAAQGSLADSAVQPGDLELPIPATASTYLRRDEANAEYVSLTSAQVLTDLSGTVNVCHFGALGDNGASNCRVAFEAAINAALTHASRASILVPLDREGGGAYRVTEGTLTIPENITLVMDRDVTIAAAGGMLVNNAAIIYPSGLANRNTPGLSSVVIRHSASALQENAIWQFRCDNESVDKEAVGSSKLRAFRVGHKYGGGTGGRGAALFLLDQIAPQAAESEDRFYTSTIFRTRSAAGDGGVLGGERGKYFGFNSLIDVDGDHVEQVSGGEINTNFTGHNLLRRDGLSIVAKDTVRGETFDAGLAIGTGGVGVPYKSAVLISNKNGSRGLDSDGIAFHVDQEGNTFGTALKIDSPVTQYLIDYTPAHAPTRFGPSLLQMGGGNPEIIMGTPGTDGVARLLFHTNSTNTQINAEIRAQDGGTGGWSGLLRTRSSTFEIRDSSNANMLLLSQSDSVNPLSIRVGGNVKKVTQGDADSGGAGYRVLRVPNT